jgi:hypothetical protein
MSCLPGWPVVLGRCADCSIGTYTIGEWYMVRDEVWEEAWAGRRKPWHALDGQGILCIGCLEKRIGRTLMAWDFKYVQVNDPNDGSISDRLWDRLTTWPRQLEMFPDDPAVNLSESGTSNGSNRWTATSGRRSSGNWRQKIRPGVVGKVCERGGNDRPGHPY